MFGLLQCGRDLPNAEANAYEKKLSKYVDNCSVFIKSTNSSLDPLKQSKKIWSFIWENSIFNFMNMEHESADFLSNGNPIRPSLANENVR